MSHSILSSKKMNPTLTVTRDTKIIKKPTSLKNGAFLGKLKFLLCSLKVTTQKLQLLYKEVNANISLQNSDQTRSKQLLTINNKFEYEFETDP